MLELTIGSRLYYQNQLYEVKEGSCTENNCIFDGKKTAANQNVILKIDMMKKMFILVRLMKKKIY